MHCFVYFTDIEYNLNRGDIMNRHKLPEHFELKRVQAEHLDQFNELLRYVFQITEDDISSSGYENEKEIIMAKRPILKKAEVWGWFDKEDLISQVAVYPFQANIHGEIYDMGGITGVGTYPEYGNMGLVSALLLKALEEMRVSNQSIAYLYPYSIPFYRKKGWETISDHMTFELQDFQLPKIKEVEGYVSRVDIDDPDVFSLYDTFARLTHGAMLRDQLAWDEYWRWDNEKDMNIAVYYNNLDKPKGLCFYWISEEILNVKEMIFLNEDARKGLWNFISNHHSMITTVKGNNYSGEAMSFLLEDSDIVETIKPYYMARIVDVKEFLKIYPFPSNVPSFHFIVEDNLAKWNEGIFAVTHNSENEIIITDEPLGEAVKLNISTLTTMLMGYKSASYLQKIGKLECSKIAMKILKSNIILEKAYFSDYF